MSWRCSECESLMIVSYDYQGRDVCKACHRRLTDLLSLHSSIDLSTKEYNSRAALRRETAQKEKHERFQREYDEGIQRQRALDDDDDIMLAAGVAAAVILSGNPSDSDALSINAHDNHSEETISHEDVPESSSYFNSDSSSEADESNSSDYSGGSDSGSCCGD